MDSSMNRRGQTLILFVFFLPIFLAIIATVIDVGLLTHEKIRLSGILNYAMEAYYEKPLEKMEIELKELLNKNKISTTDLKVQKQDNLLEVQNEYQIESIFGRIIGISNYKIIIHKQAFKKDDKIIIKNE